ncbi:hypothetical protein [Nostoc sp. PCC 7107]|uniref:hypothetical protein n=1 Tax=Nostoc sp. PCC 7107 TaxID=317936 RepID=UPI00029EF261|nr:hypothetical protein [Nostoc sp. PCC 7107]AFY44808.1 hypothetical protein Nos7107_4260 [Nostoc sp. PCC 7107]
MAVSTKNRRKIVINNRKFIWYVKDDPDSSDFVLHVISENKNFIVNYHLQQPKSTCYLIILGKEFPGLPDAGNKWIRVLCPQWEIDSIITPSSVRQLIEWCLFSERELIRVNWLGQQATT